MEPSTGRVAERPFPKLLYALAARRFTGAVALEQQGRRYAVWWKDGLIVDAESPVPEDQLGRVLKEAGLIEAAHLGELLRRLAASPDLRPLEILIEIGALAGESIARGAALGLAQRAIRVLAPSDATFAIEPQDHARIDGGPLDVRWVIYRGLRQHYDPRRLERELSPLGGFAVKLQPIDESVLEVFGFADEERYVLAYLQKGYWELPDLLEACVSLPQTTVKAIVYALVATDCLDVQPADQVPRLRKRARDATRELPKGPPPAGAGSFVRSAPVAREMPLPATPAAPSAPSAPAAAARAAAARAAAPAAPAAAAGAEARPPTNPHVRDQILRKLAAIDADADHFQILEVDGNATKEQIKAAYFQLAKTFHPDRLAVLKLEELRPQVERIFARLSEAFATLGDDARRKEYLGILAQGGEAAVKRREDEETAKAVKILSAEEHFRLGEMAMRRQMWDKALAEFKLAIEGNPDEAEHHAFYAWCLWAASSDKERVLPEVKKSLNKAIELSPKCAPAYFYFGEIYNQTGDTDRAYGCFKKALELRPGWLEAEREVRLIEMRRARGGGGGGDNRKGGGLFGKLLKK